MIAFPILSLDVQKQIAKRGSCRRSMLPSGSITCAIRGPLQCSIPFAVVERNSIGAQVSDVHNGRNGRYGVVLSSRHHIEHDRQASALFHEGRFPTASRFSTSRARLGRSGP